LLSRYLWCCVIYLASILPGVNSAFLPGAECRSVMFPLPSGAEAPVTEYLMEMTCFPAIGARVGGRFEESR
jgi:hypothetical protein